MIRGVGTNSSHVARWQSPEMPAPTILATGPGKRGGPGWLLTEGEPADMAAWIETKNRGGFMAGQRRSVDEPCWTVMASGLGGDSYSNMLIHNDGVPMPPAKPSTKPEYRVPTMPEIRALPWNGLNVISTFSGCGGSSLGYKMAGYRVLWASEFIPAARAVYAANHPGTILDASDIRKVQAADILRAVGLAEGELDLFDGSPPCASFSTAGKRAAGWGRVKKYSDTAQRTDDLFFEYARLLRGLKPKAFIAENVSGLVKGVAKGYFAVILRALKACGYRVEARMLDAQWLGVPQARQRLIFQGVREDLGLAPAWPTPLPYRYSVRDALPWIANIKGGSGAAHDSKGAAVPTSGPVPTILGTKPHQFEVEREADITRFAIGREWARTPIGGKSDRYMSLVRPHPDRPCPTVTQTAGSPSAAGVVHPYQCRKFAISELRRLCGFPDDFELSGTFSQRWERLGRAVPPVMMMHIAAAVRDGVLCKIR